MITGLKTVLPLALLMLASPPVTEGSSRGFLVERNHSEEVENAASFGEDLQRAIGSVLGCGGELDQARLEEVQQSLLPIWRALPKNEQGRIERRSLRYLAHRHFMRSGLLIRGFEVNRPPKESALTKADVLSGRVPSILEATLKSRHAEKHGFSLNDASQLILMIQQLVADSEDVLLESVFKHAKQQVTTMLSEEELGGLLEEYLVHWMLHEDEEALDILLANRSLLEQSMPHWNQLTAFARGQIKAMNFERQVKAKKGAEALNIGKYSFQDANQVVAGITNSFASFWNSECVSMNEALVKLDPQKTGRVPLAKFYGAAMETDWRFGESEAYLRELGALDESSPWRGKQVIIPNYIQAASNCIVSTPHYSVCCLNTCESLMAEIEVAIGEPLASPDILLSLIGNITLQASLDDFESGPKGLSKSLTQQLESIASAHGGMVPLHGRLFAQWLHYVFPQECPFPAITGTTKARSPTAFGNGYVASADEMMRHVVQAKTMPYHSTINAAANETQGDPWMSQWSDEEELISDYGGKLSTSWKFSSKATNIMLVVLAAAISMTAATKGGKLFRSSPLDWQPEWGKSHLV